MSDFTPLREAVDDLAGRKPSPNFDDLKRRATRRGRRRAVMVTATTAAVVAGSALAVAGSNDGRRTSPEPAGEPRPVVGAAPVWYDVNGLHRGDAVEQTPVNLMEPSDASHHGYRGALALVRSGAVYLDPATGDVWFHPWGGDPRIVGHDSAMGPGGDPDGDTAVWFERSGVDQSNGATGELVVYDTATGREISRTRQPHVVGDISCCEYRPVGNGFLQVSAERVVWLAGGKNGTEGHIYSHDVRTGTTSVVDGEDVHDQVVIVDDSGVLTVKDHDDAVQRYAEMWGWGRLSPSGDYVLGVTDKPHAAAIVDTRTGGLWRVPKDDYPLIAWSYGDIALVNHPVDGELLACDATRRTCEALPAEQPLLMPTN